MTHPATASSSSIVRRAPVVRPALAAEYAAVGDLTARAFAAGPYGHLPRSPERDTFERDAGARALSGALLVAVTAEGEILGSSTLLRQGSPQSRVARPGEAEIRLLSVDPDRQGSGAGEALVAASIAEARSWGVRAVVLDTGSLNVGAQRLYLRAGFARVTERSPAVEPGMTVQSYVYSYDLDDTAGIRIRMIRPSEFDRVAELVHDANTHDFALDDEYRESLRQVAPRAREHEVWVAEDLASGSILGSVATPRPGHHISELGRPGELDFRMLAVDVAARGRGVGELLTRHVIELARQRGLVRVVLNTGPQMLAAHRLYRRLGFELLPERFVEITDIAEPFTLLTFGLDLVAPGTRAPDAAASRHREPSA
ncbi:MAG: hypothetical protein JWR01_2115 [Subtercola sp.]|nr:hypothetical protein [Subtercola sp.]